MWALTSEGAIQRLPEGCPLPHFFGHTTHRTGISSHRQRFGMSFLPRALIAQAIKHHVSRYFSNIPR
ncbi:MAG: hypothetical protein WCD06_07810, partial [Candidatus Sulfotelmatobacter sp.]